MLPDDRGRFATFFRVVLLGGAVIALAALERWRPLRGRRESIVARAVRNGGIACLSALVVSGLDRPCVLPVARFAERRRWGLLLVLPLPPAVRGLLGVLLLDYTMYLWHVLLHRVPWLWRFHIVHHADLDLDSWTAIRFHFGELVASVPFRISQVLLLGITPRTLTAWQALLFGSVVFHHSNVRLPIELERLLNRLIVTPRMHGIHHSVVPAEMQANWSSGLTLWDAIQGTLRLNVPQHEITIGVAAYRAPEEVGFARMVMLPLESPPPPSRLPESGQEPRRPGTGVPPTYLLP